MILANGDEIVTTPEHPWLANRYAHKTARPEWIASCDLMGSPGLGNGRRTWRTGDRRPFYVYEQVRPWNALPSFEAGWLAGMFDGEGSLSLGEHGTPKMVLCQVNGPVIDQAQQVMTDLGYGPNRIARTNTPAHRQPVSNLYVTNGFPGLLRALGELRPVRLLDKWADLDVSTRTVKARKVAVVAIEPAGFRDIQQVETSSGTYIGEGYLMHNCYGNRMADHHEARDSSRRITYRHTLGRPLSPNNAGAMQWGDSYRALHLAVWREALRVPRSGGLALVNVRDHIRRRALMPVVLWHRSALAGLGFAIEDVEAVTTRRHEKRGEP